MARTITIIGAITAAVALIGIAYTGNSTPLGIATLGAAGWALLAAHVAAGKKA